MTDVSVWLNEHGLGKYADRFAASDISFDLLAELNQDDLRELGLSLGHQKLFLKQVKALLAETTGPATNSQKSPPVPAGPASALSASERRQLTVMFCDLANSTSIVNQIGAEEMQELYRDYQQACTEAVQPFNGYIAKYLGDGILVYFGYPQAHELDPDRAIRAGLQIVELVKRLDHKYNQSIGINVAVRIGIATGPVVVGDIIGEGEARETAVVGETPNLAARIQSIAPLDSVSVSELTRKLASPAFDFADHGRHSVKGFINPIHVWTAIGKRNIDSRFRARQKTSNTELIGRHQELAQLASCWQTVAQGEGQLVSVTGEAGIGKSHLIETFLEQSWCPEQQCLRFQCSPYHTGTILFPVLEQIERDISAQGDNGGLVDSDNLLAFFSGSPACQIDAARYFGSLLSVTAIEADNDHDISIQALQQRAFRGWIGRLTHRARSEPLIVILEDAHWLDATSTELFSQLIDNIDDASLMLVVTSRPDFTLPWKSHRSLSTELTLSRIDKHEGEEIITRISGAAQLPREFHQLILDKTDGVPLFVEELTKSVMEHAQQFNNGHSTDIDTMISSLDIPETLNDLLMSRLDKEPSIKGVAQIGAAIGRDFAWQLLASVAPHEEPELRRLLDAVVSSDLVFETGSQAGATYTFRHALLQEAAYRSLLKKNRRILHAKIAESMQAGHIEGSSAELVAHHWTQAAQPAKAVRCWQQAAREATSIWANVEAINRYRKALAAFAKLDSQEQSTELKIELLLELGDALRAASGSSDKETIEVFKQASRLCQSVKDVDLCVRSYYGYFATQFTAARLEEAQSTGSKLLSLSKNNNHIEGIAAGHQAMGMHAFATGNLPVARTQLELALDFKQQTDFAYDVQYPVLAQSYLCWTLYWLDEKTAARELLARAMAEAESVSAYDHALMMANACYLYQFEDKVSALALLSAELKSLSEAKGFPVWYAVADFFDCWQQCRNDPAPARLDKLVAALAFWAEDEIETPYFKAIVAEMLLRNNRFTEGEQLAREAQTLMRETGEVWYRNQLDATCERYLSNPA